MGALRPLKSTSCFITSIKSDQFLELMLFLSAALCVSALPIPRVTHLRAILQDTTLPLPEGFKKWQHAPRIKPVVKTVNNGLELSFHKPEYALFTGNFEVDGNPGACPTSKCVAKLPGTKQPRKLTLIMRMSDNEELDLPDTKKFKLIYSLASDSPDGMTTEGGSLRAPFKIFGKDATAKIIISKNTLKVLIKPTAKNGLISKMGEKWTITRDEVTSEFVSHGGVMIATANYNKLNLRALAENIFYLNIGDETAKLKFYARNLPAAFE
jgi:hypothetical protein